MTKEPRNRGDAGSVTCVHLGRNITIKQGHSWLVSSKMQIIQRVNLTLWMLPSGDPLLRDPDDSCFITAGDPFSTRGRLLLMGSGLRPPCAEGKTACGSIVCATGTAWDVHMGSMDCADTATVLGNSKFLFCTADKMLPCVMVISVGLSLMDCWKFTANKGNLHS